MPQIIFSYRALDKDGKPAQGTVEAPNKEEALAKIKELRSQGFRDISVNEIKVDGIKVDEETVQPRPASHSATKKCPYCAEGIKYEAIHCRFCNKSISATALHEAAKAEPSLREESKLSKWSREQEEKTPLWLRIIILPILIFMIFWLPTLLETPSSKLRKKNVLVHAEANQKAKDRQLEQNMFAQFRDVGVVKVIADGSVMDVHVTPEAYKLLFSNRLEGNRVMRSWKELVSRNSDTTFGAVRLFSGGQKVAETEAANWTGSETRVKWLDA